MGFIKINMDLVKSQNSRLKTNQSTISDISRRVTSLGPSVDPKIKRRRNIQNGFSEAAYGLNEIADDLQNLRTFINNSMEAYTKVDEKLSNLVKQLRSIDLFPANNTSAKPDSTDKNGFDILGDIGKYAVTGQSLTAIALVLGEQVQFLPKNGNKARAVIHTAQWIKGKGNQSLLKRLVRTMDKAIRNPGPTMKAFMKVS